MFKVSKKVSLALCLATTMLFSFACSDDDDPDDDNVSGSLVINEISAKNSSIHQDEAGDYDDWIELYNAGDVDIDVGGYWLSDDNTNPYKWKIPEDVSLLTTVQAGEYLIIWADDEPDEGVLHATFSLKGTGEFLGLYGLSGDEVDQVVFGPQNEDISYGRLPNGGSTWQYLDPPTPGASNSNQATNRPPLISNVSRVPEYVLPDEKIYIRAEISDEGSVENAAVFYRVNEGDFIEAEMSLEFAFTYVVEIDGQEDGALFEYYVSATDNNSLTSTDPTYAPVSMYSFNVLEFSDDRTLFINEVQAQNEQTIPDNNGEYEDWIEIYNHGSEAIDIGGLYITDDLSNPYAHQIPANQSFNTTIPAGGFIILWADDDLEQGVLHLPFKLSASGESVGLFSIIDDQSILLDGVNYKEIEEDESYGRSEDGSSSWMRFEVPTPGAGNNL